MFRQFNYNTCWQKQWFDIFVYLIFILIWHYKTEIWRLLLCCIMFNELYLYSWTIKLDIFNSFFIDGMCLWRNWLSSSVYDMFADIFCDCQRGKDIHSQKRYTNKAMLSMYTGRNDDMELLREKRQKYHCCRSTKTKKDKRGISKAWQGIERQRGRRENEGTSNRTDNNRNSDSLPLTSLANTNTLTSLCKQFTQALAIMQFMTIDYHNSFFHDQSVISLVFYGQCNGLCICWVLCFFWGSILILIEENVFE